MPVLNEVVVQLDFSTTQVIFGSHAQPHASFCRWSDPIGALEDAVALLWDEIRAHAPCEVSFVRITCGWGLPVGAGTACSIIGIVRLHWSMVTCGGWLPVRGAVGYTCEGSFVGVRLNVSFAGVCLNVDNCVQLCTPVCATACFYGACLNVYNLIVGCYDACGPWTPPGRLFP